MIELILGNVTYVFILCTFEDFRVPDIRLAPGVELHTPPLPSQFADRLEQREESRSLFRRGKLKMVQQRFVGVSDFAGDGPWLYLHWS